MYVQYSLDNEGIVIIRNLLFVGVSAPIPRERTLKRDKNAAAANKNNAKPAPQDLVQYNI